MKKKKSSDILLVRRKPVNVPMTSKLHKNFQILGSPRKYPLLKSKIKFSLLESHSTFLMSGNQIKHDKVPAAGEDFPTKKNLTFGSLI